MAHRCESFEPLVFFSNQIKFCSPFLYNSHHSSLPSHSFQVHEACFRTFKIFSYLSVHLDFEMFLQVKQDRNQNLLYKQTNKQRLWEVEPLTQVQMPCRGLAGSQSHPLLLHPHEGFHHTALIIFPAKF